MNNEAATNQEKQKNDTIIRHTGSDIWEGKRRNHGGNDGLKLITFVRLVPTLVELSLNIHLLFVVMSL